MESHLIKFLKPRGKDKLRSVIQYYSSFAIMTKLLKHIKSSKTDRNFREGF